jgi:multisubunit Na+/H+ antiporter MnhE subunit
MIFLVFFVFSVSMISLGFLVSTLVQTQASANTVSKLNLTQQLSYTLILVTIIFELVFSNPDVNNRFFFSATSQNDSKI